MANTSNIALLELVQSRQTEIGSSKLMVAVGPRPRQHKGMAVAVKKFVKDCAGR